MSSTFIICKVVSFKTEIIKVSDGTIFLSKADKAVSVKALPKIKHIICQAKDNFD